MNKMLIKRLNDIVWIIVLIDTIFLFLTTFSTIPNHILFYIYLFDFIVCIILWIEFSYNLYYADNKKEFLKKNWYYIISMIPLDFFFIRAFRFIRIIRLFRLTRALLLIKAFTKKTHLDKLLIILLIFIVISTISLFIIEPSFDSLFNAFWYVIVTLTSVGYGDMVPISQNGKILAFTIIIVGIIFFSVFTAAIASIYIEKLNENTEVDYENSLKEVKSQIEEIFNHLENIEEKYQLKMSADLDELNEKLDNVNKSIVELSEKIDK